jgi:hypothetical protein
MTTAISPQEIAAVAWATLERAASKECRREVLDEGAKHEVELRIDGTVDQQPFTRSVRGQLSIGHAGVRNSSSAPDACHLVGLILGKLSAKIREKLLDELPEQFAQLERLPEVPAARIEEAKNLMDRLRTKVQQQVKPQVSLSYTVGKS